MSGLPHLRALSRHARPFLNAARQRPWPLVQSVFPLFDSTSLPWTRAELSTTVSPATAQISFTADTYPYMKRRDSFKKVKEDPLQFVWAETRENFS